LITGSSENPVWAWVDQYLGEKYGRLATLRELKAALQEARDSVPRDCMSACLEVIKLEGGKTRVLILMRATTGQINVLIYTHRSDVKEAQYLFI
jgi:hypothetical protein